MSRRIGWRLRRKYRPFRMMAEEKKIEKPVPKKQENRVIQAKKEAAESYIKYLDRLHR